MLLNIRVSDKTLRAYKNDGHQDSRMVEDLPGLCKVCLNENLMINIISFSDVHKRFRISMDTDVEKIMVHIGEERKVKFR